MASLSTGAPDNIPFPAGSDQYALVSDLQTMASQIAARFGTVRGLLDGKLTVGQKWTAADNLGSWWQAGVWGVTDAQGMPDGVTSAIMLQAEAGNNAWQRLWISFGVNAGIWLQYGNELTGVWHPATPLAPDALDAGLAHELRVQDLQRRRARTTTAKGVVVFVLDHGYSGFMDKAWPDLQARGFPATWALNTVHPAAIDTGDTGLDWAAIKTLAAANPDTLEVAAHSANHGNIAEDPTALRAAIIDHKTELETLTGAKVDSWVQPGATLGDFVKDNAGTPDDYAGTMAGRMIAATYAAATGYITTPRTFKLDGTPDLGVVGNWLDTGAGSIMTYVNSVATNGGYTIVRLHPQYMDQTGYITRAQWQGFLDQVKALVDAGTVEVLTLRDAAVTTPATFTPSGHTHTIAQVDGLQTKLDGLDYSTGWQSIPVVTGAGYAFDGTGTIQVRRRGGAVPADDLVDVRFKGVGVLTGTSAGAYLTPQYFLPQGFRGWFDERTYTSLGSTNGNGIYQVCVMQASRLRLGIASSVPGTGVLALQGTMTFLADGARPTL